MRYSMYNLVMGPIPFVITGLGLGAFLELAFRLATYFGV